MELNDIPNINSEEEKLLDIYMKLLLEWNEKMNLTAITQKDDIIVKHFIDSLSILKYIENNQNIIDVGTGAGFPGIPVKIMNDTLKITLVDSLNKRVNFLNEVIKVLNLKQTNTVHARAEDLGRMEEYREKFDIATSRAVANLSTLLEYLMPFIKVGGKCICMKGANIEEELKNAENAIKELGGKVEKVNNFILPNSDIERNIIIIKKVKKLNNKYPRNAGIPAKNPIK